MKLLLADDDPIARKLLRCTLTKWGYDLVVCADGDQAWRELSGPDAPAVAILDWMMPGMDGLELCRRLRNTPVGPSMYLILLTANNRPDQVAAGLEAGADDYIAKQFRHEELRARIRAGIRIVELHRALQERVRQLEEALSNVKQLQGLLPICSYCKKIRNDRNYWERLESYISGHTDAQFSHGICPVCYAQLIEREGLNTEGLENALQGEGHGD
jgi:CheY-like chemotaxis protein